MREKFPSVIRGRSDYAYVLAHNQALHEIDVIVTARLRKLCELAEKEAGKALQCLFG